jgi:hypothetical protein
MKFNILLYGIESFICSLCLNNEIIIEIKLILLLKKNEENCWSRKQTRKRRRISGFCRSIFFCGINNVRVGGKILGSVGRPETHFINNVNYMGVFCAVNRVYFFIIMSKEMLVISYCLIITRLISSISGKWYTEIKFVKMEWNFIWWK